MKTKKKYIEIVGFVLLISFVIVSMCSCSKSATVQIDDLYKLEAKEDVINYLGKPDPKIQQSESYDIYKVLFKDEVFSLIVFYEDEMIDSLKMEYFFGGLTEKELRAPRDYSTEEIKAAENLVKSIVSSFTAKYGKGEIIPTKVNTVIYAWDFDGNENPTHI